MLLLRLLLVHLSWLLLVCRLLPLCVLYWLRMCVRLVLSWRWFGVMLSDCYVLFRLLSNAEVLFRWPHVPK